MVFSPAAGVRATPSTTGIPSLCISSFSGGGGKTLFSLGLTRALTARGFIVQPFKKGPDYIDAAWLALAARRPATNLDPYVLSPDQLRGLFVHGMERARASCVVTPKPGVLMGLIEGNRGLFDGLDLTGSCSTAALARVLDCPIILSVNCTKMTRTVAALVCGMSMFEPGLTFAGVVLNHVGSARHENILRRALEEYTDVKVLGALPRLDENPLPERHMGIGSRGDGLAPDADAILDTLGTLVAEHVDFDAILAAAGVAASPQGGAEENDISMTPEPAAAVSSAVVQRGAPRPRIGYVRDSALWFYYEENLEALEQAGAELVRLTLVGEDVEPWPVMRGERGEAGAAGSLDALYLGGGFPEDYALQLSTSPHLQKLEAWADAGMPMYAECGGFMILARGIERAGRLWPMSSIFPVVAQFCEKPQGLGYVRGTVVAENPYFPLGLELRGHEFHYSRCRWEGAAPHALRLDKGRGMGRALDGLLRHNVWASYTHIFAPAVPCWACNFVAAARQFSERNRV